jgi:hypothetical protein
VKFKFDLASHILPSSFFSVLDVEPDNDEYVFDDEISEEMLLEIYQLEVEEIQRKLDASISHYHLFYIDFTP